MCPENLGNVWHVQPPQSGSDQEVHHGHHAVELSLVHWDAGGGGSWLGIYIKLAHCVITVSIFEIFEYL